jgi:hypothetical protein
MKNKHTRKSILKISNYLMILFASLFLSATSTKAQYGIEFNGAGYTLISQPAAANFYFGTGDFTWNSWIKTTDMGAFKSITGSYTNSSNKFFFGVNSGKFIAAVGNLTSGNSTTVVSDGNWHFVTATRLSGNLKVYVDGVLEDSVTNAGNVNSSQGLAFGKYEGSGYFYVGTVDMMSFWDTAHAAIQVIEDMNRCSFIGTEPGLRGAFEFNEGSGDSTMDVTNTYTAYFMGGLDTTAAWVAGHSFILTTSVTNNSPTLTSDAPGHTYQWVDCNNGYAPISGETNQSFTATANGSYAVILTQNGCSDTSACEMVTNTGINEIIQNNLKVYPNPATESLNITSAHDFSAIIITDVNGRVIYTSEVNNKQATIDIRTMSNGVYLLQIMDSSRQMLTQQRIIISK